MKHELPAYLREKNQATGTVLFTAFFALLFLLISIPSAHNAWFDFNGPDAIGYTLTYYLCSVLVIALSKALLYLTRNAFKVSHLGYGLWCLAEVLLCSLLYLLFSVAGYNSGRIDTFGLSRAEMFRAAFIYSLISITIPGVLSAMYFAIQDRDKTIRLMSTGDIVSDDEVQSGPMQKVTLYDNSGVIKMSISPDHLYLISSDDNYVIVSYTDSVGQMKKYMIRCRLKTIEASFKGSSLVRCHRRYIVNMDKVKVLRKEKDGWELDFLNESLQPIAVSKTYADDVLARFEDRHPSAEA